MRECDVIGRILSFGFRGVELGEKVSLPSASAGEDLFLLEEEFAQG